MSHLTVQELSASLDGVLSGPALERVVTHLSACHDCRDHQARLAKHDDALRRLLASDPNDRFIDELARRTEALVVAIVRGLPVPPIVTSTSLEDADGEGAGGRAKDRSREIAKQAGYGLIGMKPGAPPKPAAAEPEPPRVTPDASGERAARSAPAAATGSSASLELPKLKQPESTHPREEPGPAKKSGLHARGAELKQAAEREKDAGTPPAPRRIAHDGDGYDSFNDSSYLGPGEREPEVGPPRAGPPPAAPASAASPPPAAPPPAVAKERPATSLARALDARASAAAPSRGDAAPAAPGPADAAATATPHPGPGGFGVAHTRKPAWERLGLEPDPFAPGVYRDPLGDEVMDPPPITARVTSARAPSAPRRIRRRSRSIAPVVVGAVGTVAALLVVFVALQVWPAKSGPPTLFGVRIPRVEFVRRHADPPTPTRAESQVREAATRPPVDRAVSPAPGRAAGAAPERVCGQVVNGSGRPLAGVSLTVEGTPAPVRTDADGRFCLDAPAGPHVVLLQGEAGRAQRLTLEFAAGAPEIRLLLP